MGSIIFVHGTGVRQDGYEKSFQAIDASLKLDGFLLRRCVWGEVHGSRLLQGGGSIPGYSGRSSSAQPDDDVLKWTLLYQDPDFQLEQLKEQGDRELPPRMRARWREEQARVAAWQPSSNFTEVIEPCGLGQQWQKAFEAVAKSDTWEGIFPPRDRGVEEFLPEFCRCAAESIMARTTLAALAAGVSIPAADIRDRIVNAFLDDLGIRVRGLRDWFGALGRATKRILLPVYAAGDYAVSRVVTTPLVRNFITDLSLEAIGDILFYQARGARIRDFIEAEIEKAEPPVFLLAHSLGGIACVDLLALKEDVRRKVHGLITAGSQSPLFYEMNCLVSLPRTQETPSPGLPGDFPPWLNFHDPNDYLSYAARRAFHDHDRITDREVTSRQPRVMAHSAYWSQEKLWTEVRTFIREHAGAAR